MNLIELIKSRRSIRQFQPKALDHQILLDCIDAARVAPSAANRQPLHYILVTEREQVDMIFPLLRWAGYIQPHGDPQPGQRPTAYLIVLIDEEIGETWKYHDVGAAVENFILAAWSYGIGSCWLASVDRAALRSFYQIPAKYTIDTVVALGYPAEEPLLENSDETVRYWKDADGRLHVPKRTIDAIVHLNGFNSKE